MNDDREPRADTFIGMFQVAGTRNYLIVGFAALIVYFLLMSARGSETGAFLVLLIAVPGLLARWVISPIAVLTLTTYLLIDPNFLGLLGLLDNYLGVQGSRFRLGYQSGSGVEAAIENLLLTAALLAYLMAQYRLQSLVLRSIPENQPKKARGQPTKAVMRPAHLVSDTEMGTMLIVGAACVAGGLIGWWLLREMESILRVSRDLRIRERGFARFMVFVWVFGVGLLIARAVLGYRADRHMSAEEARLVMHDAFWTETRREQERIYRWREWYRKRNEARLGGS